MLAKFKESAQGIAAIAALAAVFWGVKHHSLAELTASSGEPARPRVRPTSYIKPE